MSEVAKIWVDGLWAESNGSDTFAATDPCTGQELSERFPISNWLDCQQALAGAAAAFEALSTVGRTKIADFLDRYAAGIESVADSLVDTATVETALPRSPRLREVELPRTVNQLRLAATACRDGSWALPTIDTAAGIRSLHAALGPVLILGPNNFPFAFNGISGGDFAAAIAAGNPVIVKGHPGHPGTTRRLAELAAAALEASGLPSSTVQLLYHMEPEDGLAMIRDPRLASIAFTGSRRAGLRLKQECDVHGKPAYLEMSSINPVVILPGALRERSSEIAQEFVGSCLMGAGQFCTNPGLILLLEDPASSAWVDEVTAAFAQAAAGTLLSRQVLEGALTGLEKVQQAGATVLTGGRAVEGGDRLALENTLLSVSASKFMEAPEALQSELFGPVSMVVTAQDVDQAVGVLQRLEGNLTGCLYSARDGSEDTDAVVLAAVLRRRVGRLLNDKMPTGVAVSPAMNHGGPYPSSGHPGFTAVGIPASLRRFSALHCYDQVRTQRLPDLLRDDNPSGCWRLVDGQWTQAAAG